MNYRKCENDAFVEFCRGDIERDCIKVCRGYTKRDRIKFGVQEIQKENVLIVMDSNHKKERKEYVYNNKETDFDNY